MTTPRQPNAPRRPSGRRALLAGLVLLGAVGSRELPKPHLPSIGATDESPRAVARA